MRSFSLVCFFLLLASPSSALFGRDKTENKNEPRRRLTETKTGNIDVDAATGTVRKILSAEEMAAMEAEKAASTCDGQMAQSLVKANDEMLKAQNERDSANQAKQEALERVASLEEAVKKLNSEMANMESSHTQVVKALQSTISSTEAEGVANVQKVKEEGEIELQKANDRVQKAKDDGVASVEKVTALKDAKIDELEKKLTLSQADIRKELNSKLQKLREESEAALEAKDDERSQLEKTFKIREQEMEDEVKERESQIETVKAEMAEQAKQAEAMLVKTKDEAKTFLLSQVNLVKDEMNEAKTACDAVVAEKETTITELTDQLKGVVLEKVEVSKSLEKTKAELEHWKETFNNRSYCDLSLIGNDLYSATYSASKAALGHSTRAASLAASEADRSGRVLYESAKVYGGELKKHSAIAYEKSAAVYAEQKEKHWPKVKPHYDQHVLPLVNKFSAWKEKEVTPRYEVAKAKYQEVKEREIDPRIKVAIEKGNAFKESHVDPQYEKMKSESSKLYNKMKKEGSQKFKNVSKSYAESCYEALKLGKQIGKEKDLPFDDVIAPYMMESCKNPEESLTYFAYGCLIILALLFRRRIIRLVSRLIVGTLGFLWAVLVTLTPLRFFVSRKKPAAKKSGSEANKTKNEVRVKKKGKSARAPQ